tara:strand:+ start:4293 stop:5270 length:978 start_codon:yes stop_codon:yes gene_type:complete
MIYELIKTFLLLGHTSIINPAQKALEITYVIMYPAFVIITVIAIHITIDLYRAIWQPQLAFVSNDTPTKHLDSLTRVVIDSMVYTLMVSLWGHIFNKYKNYSLHLVNSILSISQNFHKIYIADIFTLLILFSMYFDVQFYITSSSLLLIIQVIVKRYKRTSHHTADMVTHENVSIFYKTYAEKPYKYIKNIISKYTAVDSKFDTPVVDIQVLENKSESGNILKIVNQHNDETIYYNRDIVLNEFQPFESDSGDEPEWLTTQHIHNSLVICNIHSPPIDGEQHDPSCINKNLKHRYHMHLDINICIILERHPVKTSLKKCKPRKND